MRRHPETGEECLYLSPENTIGVDGVASPQVTGLRSLNNPYLSMCFTLRGVGEALTNPDPSPQGRALVQRVVQSLVRHGDASPGR